MQPRTISSYLDFYFTSLLYDVAKLRRRQSGEHRLTDLDVHRYNSTVLCQATQNDIRRSHCSHKVCCSEIKDRSRDSVEQTTEVGVDFG